MTEKVIIWWAWRQRGGCVIQWRQSGSQPNWNTAIISDKCIKAVGRLYILCVSFIWFVSLLAKAVTYERSLSLEGCFWSIQKHRRMHECVHMSKQQQRSYIQTYVLCTCVMLMYSFEFLAFKELFVYKPLSMAGFVYVCMFFYLTLNQILSCFSHAKKKNTQRNLQYAVLGVSSHCDHLCALLWLNFLDGDPLL